MPVELRPTGAADQPFLVEMLVAAAYWRVDGPRGTVRDVLSRPELARYVMDWPQPGEIGVIAEAESPVGAAWLRFLPPSNPGYGFVDAAIPELAMGVVEPSRGRGVGAALLGALMAAARERSLSAVSLSVEPDNHALRLYERFGFRQVGTMSGSLTMLLRLQGSGD